MSCIEECNILPAMMFIAFFIVLLPIAPMLGEAMNGPCVVYLRIHLVSRQFELEAALAGCLELVPATFSRV